MLSGFMPSRSGAYGNSNNMLEAPLVQEYATLPEYFSKNGYRSLSMGKIFHKHDVAHGIDAGQWAFDHYEPTRGGSTVNSSTGSTDDSSIKAISISIRDSASSDRYQASTGFASVVSPT